MKRIHVCLALIALAAVGTRRAALAQRDGARSTPPPLIDISSCAVPTDVQSNLPMVAGQQIPYFDSYSWRAFAALVCDAQSGHRGQADAQGGRNGAGPRVFETFKSAWEIFHSGQPSAIWDQYADESANPCKNAQQGDLVLASTSKFLDTEQAGPSANLRLPPLPAQNGAYVRYLTQYNRDSFQYIAANGSDMEGGSITFPARSINVKSAWIEMKNLDPARFYSRYAWVPRPGGTCEQVLVGLAGLHIVQKTPTQKHWIWSTFEQVDNAPDAGDCTKPPRPYTFNNGNCEDEMPAIPPANKPDAPPKQIFNVQRSFHLISGKTVNTNGLFQAKFQGSRWQYYELVMTQWSLDDAPPAKAGDPAHTFPGTNAETAFANTVMETFFQRDVQYGCMGCHGSVAADADFVWSLRIEPPGLRSIGISSLKKVFLNSGIAIR